MKENAVKRKSYEFAVRIVNTYKHLCSKKKEFVLSKQLLKCGTSVGANVSEAIGGYSKADFTNKIQISYKETLETAYWLELLYETGYLNKSGFESLSRDCDELSKILYSIIRTSKNLRKQNN